MCTSWSPPAATQLPSGAAATMATCRPAGVLCAALVSQSRTLPSSAPVASQLPSRANTIAATRRPECPGSLASVLPVAVSSTTTGPRVLSANAAFSPSGVTAVARLLLPPERSVTRLTAQVPVSHVHADPPSSIIVTTPPSSANVSSPMPNLTRPVSIPRVPGPSMTRASPPGILVVPGIMSVRMI